MQKNKSTNQTLKQRWSYFSGKNQKFHDLYTGKKKQKKNRKEKKEKESKKNGGKYYRVHYGERKANEREISRSALRSFPIRSKLL